jgi:hypothetical protein
MNRRKSERQKTEPLQPADFPPPKRVSQEKVSEICEWPGISDRHAAELKDYLDDLVDCVHELMSQKKAANRRGDRARILNMLEGIKYIREELQDLRIDGRLAVRSTAERLADILSGDWMRYHFPNDAPSKPMHGGNRPPQRQPVRGNTDTDITYFNYQFIRSRAPQTLKALLQDLESALALALTSLDSRPGARGGRQPLTHRHVVILNLANIWHQTGKKPVGTHDSVFAVFCEAIFEAMGWPTDGLDSAIPPAIKSLRNRR